LLLWLDGRDTLYEELDGHLAKFVALLIFKKRTGLHLYVSDIRLVVHDNHPRTCTGTGMKLGAMEKLWYGSNRDAEYMGNGYVILDLTKISWNDDGQPRSIVALRCHSGEPWG